MRRHVFIDTKLIAHMLFIRIYELSHPFFVNAHPFYNKESDFRLLEYTARCVGKPS